MTAALSLCNLPVIKSGARIQTIQYHKWNNASKGGRNAE